MFLGTFMEVERDYKLLELVKRTVDQVVAKHGLAQVLYLLKNMKLEETGKWPVKEYIIERSIV